MGKKLSTGKIPKELLEHYVFPYLGSKGSRVLAGASVGEDAAILDYGEKVLVAKANPITGAEKNIGWLVVNINANDIAARGATPLWYLNIVLMPEGTDESLLETIMKDQHRACVALGVSIVGGHTEVAPGLTRPIVSGFMLGEADKNEYVTSGGAQIGDHIILTKGVGLEGTSILATDLRARLDHIPEKILDNAMRFIDRISVLPEARAAAQFGVHAMHTPTEGGVLNGLIEFSSASNTGFKVYEERFSILEETQLICEALEVDPLRLMSSGSLLIVVEGGRSTELVKLLNHKGVPAKVIGEVVSDRRIIVRLDGSEEAVVDVDQDELFRVLEEQP